MFDLEISLQALIDQQPDIILSGIPDMDPTYSTDVPMWLSLGREIQLDSGPLDNLFIDANGILTLVECKLYRDGRIKRELYPQALNYAADITQQLMHVDGQEFQAAFMDMLSGAQAPPFVTLQGLMDALAEDPMLQGKQRHTWQTQFLHRLESNIKGGFLRIVMLCAPNPGNAFSPAAVRNLIRIMDTTEIQTRHELLLMDLRFQHEIPISRIIWRRFTALPRVALSSETARNSARGIEQAQARRACLPEAMREKLAVLVALLARINISTNENTYGYALIDGDTQRSLYILLWIDDDVWRIYRHQIHECEALFHVLSSEAMFPPSGRADIRDKVSKAAGGRMREARYTPTVEDHPEQLVELVCRLSGRVNG